MPQTHFVFCLSARLPSGVFRSGFRIHPGTRRERRDGSRVSPDKPRVYTWTPSLSPKQNIKVKEKLSSWSKVGFKSSTFSFPFYSANPSRRGKKPTPKFDTEIKTLIFFKPSFSSQLPPKKVRIILLIKLIICGNARFVSSPLLHPCFS